MLRVLEGFGGIGSVHKALTNLGIAYEMVDMIEFDQKPVTSYNAIHGTNFVPQDITKWNKPDMRVDYAHFSTPCQAFSTAGKQLGAEDDRGIPLWDATLNVIRITKPRFITLENVKGLLNIKHKELVDYYISELDKLGYVTTYKVLNAKHYGVPQNRERVFFVSVHTDGILNENTKPIFEEFLKELMPNSNEVTSKLKDILQPDAKWETIDLKSNDVFCLDNKIYTKNKLSQYTGKTIEIDIKKLMNQKPGEINRVAKLKKPLFDDLIKDVAQSLDNIGTGDRNDFMGEDGVNVCLTTRSADEQKVMVLEDVDKISSKHQIGINGVTPTLDTRCDQDPKILAIEDLDFNSAKSYHGTNGIAGNLRAAADSVHEQKVLELESIPFNSDSMFMGTQGTTQALVASQPDFKGKIVDIEDINFSQVKSFTGENGVFQCYTDNNGTGNFIMGNIKYRKLLPVETWLLMGFTVEDFNKASKVTSPSQLTKQAGNSIVVNVMEAILGNLFIKFLRSDDEF